MLPLQSIRSGSAVLPACLGFVAGAVFWHVIGFWAFVGQVVLDRPAQYAGQLAAAHPTGPAPDERLAAGSNAIANCARLTLDRGGNTVVAACQAGPVEAVSVHGEPLQRGDLSIAPGLPEARPGD